MSVTLPCCDVAVSASAALMASRMPVGIAERGFDGNAGENALVGAGDDDVPAGGDAPRRNEAGQQALQAVDGRGPILPDRGDAVETLGEQIGDRRQVALDGPRAFAGSGRPPGRMRQGRS